MIRFNCPSCGRGYAVDDALAGRAAKCSCGQPLKVPAASAATTAPSAAPTLRDRRLAADEAELRRAFGDGRGVVRLVSSEGSPATRYTFELRVRSLAPGASPDRPVPRDAHTCEVALPDGYPRLPPRVRLTTPSFHPNVDATAVCVGDHWAAGEKLSDLVYRVAEMLAFQSYNVRSPLNAEAAMWADLNAGKLPTDARDMRAVLSPSPSGRGPG